MSFMMFLAWVPPVAEAEMSPRHLPRDEENPFSELFNPLLLASTR